jgi:four helix bundle protein
MREYQDLRLRTKKFALASLKLFRTLPRTVDAQVVGKQFVRSATSVAANYRAVQRARSKAEFIAKLGVVLEEADETQFWLELLSESQITVLDELPHLQNEIGQLVAIFVSSLKTAKA